MSLRLWLGKKSEAINKTDFLVWEKFAISWRLITRKKPTQKKNGNNRNRFRVSHGERLGNSNFACDEKVSRWQRPKVDENKVQCYWFLSLKQYKTITVSGLGWSCFRSHLSGNQRKANHSWTADCNDLRWRLDSVTTSCEMNRTPNGLAFFFIVIEICQHPRARKKNH